MKNIRHEHLIRLFDNQEPLTFAYKKSRENPDSHSLHINNYIEVFVYISGDVDYIVGDSYYTLKKGDVIVINPHEVHKAVVKTSEIYERFYILIPIPTFSKLTYDPLQKFLNRRENSSAVITLPSKAAEEIERSLYSIDSLCETGGDSKTLAAFGEIIRLMCIIDSYATNENPTSQSPAKVLPLLIKDTLSHIDRNLTEILSVSDIADSLHVSLPYMSTLFKKYIGVNINSYIRVRRVALAKRLLDDGASVTDACFDSGFHDCSYFIKCFKRYIGVTPLKYANARRKL